MKKRDKPEKERFRRNSNSGKKYVETFRRSLHLKDKTTKEAIVKEIEKTVLDLTGPGSSYASIKQRMGDPVELGRKLSDPKNWSVEMGNPLKPKVPIKGFISPKGRMLLFVTFLGLLLVSIALLVLPEGPPFGIPLIIIAFTTLWAMIADMLNRFLGYVGSLKELLETEISVDHPKRDKLRSMIFTTAMFEMILTWALGLGPLLIYPSALILSFGLAIGTSVTILITVGLVLRELRSIP